MKFSCWRNSLVPEIKIPELTEAEVTEVKDNVASKLGLCKKQNDIIGLQIFSILGLYARVIYYPLGKDAVWGFTRIQGSAEEAHRGKPFVAINTSIPMDCQIFAAAHELYHIWFDNKIDVVPANIIDEATEDRNELKANRFAAEFLVEEELLRKELRLYSIEQDKITVKDILKLCELFSVPYRTMVKRLYEIGLFSKVKRIEYLEISDDDLIAARKRYAFLIPEADNRIAIDNLTDLAVDAYDNRRITFEKLEYLLGLSELTPSDVGISAPTKYTFPSDSELEEIMGE